MGLLNLNTTILEMKHTKQEKKLSKNDFKEHNQNWVYRMWIRKLWSNGLITSLETIRRIHLWIIYPPEDGRQRPIYWIISF